MSTALLIARREFASYFRSWLGPVRVAGTLLADGVLFYWLNGLDQKQLSGEVLTRFFDERGAPRSEMMKRIAGDVSVLLVPTPARALLLDKAYRVIVQEQSFARGRDATVTPVVHMHRELPEDELATGVTEPVLDRRRAPRTATR